MTGIGIIIESEMYPCLRIYSYREEKMDPLNIVVWLIIGALAGLITALITQSRTTSEVIMDLVVGLVGGFIGGYALYVLNAMGTGVVIGINISGVVVAVIGAVILLGLLEFLRRPSD
jgi:uncharacterized membrane protein YeaQ/YmgE (transglycosylase-associated protein family)